MKLRELRVAIPEGWSVRETVREVIGDRVVVNSPDDREQVTISTAAMKPTFEAFEKLCRFRPQIEQRRPNVRLRITQEPSDENGRFVMSYFGYEPAVARMFSASLLLEPPVGGLLTVYIEGVSVDGERHTASFRTFVSAAWAWYAHRTP